MSWRRMVVSWLHDEVRAWKSCRAQELGNSASFQKTRHSQTHQLLQVYYIKLLSNTHTHTREVSQHNKDVPGQGATTARKLFPATKASHSSDNPVIKSEPGDNLHQTSINKTDNTSLSQPRPWRQTYVRHCRNCRRVLSVPQSSRQDSTDLTDITLPGIIFDAQV